LETFFESLRAAFLTVLDRHLCKRVLAMPHTRIGHVEKMVRAKADLSRSREQGQHN